MKTSSIKETTICQKMFSQMASFRELPWWRLPVSRVWLGAGVLVLGAGAAWCLVLGAAWCWCRRRNPGVRWWTRPKSASADCSQTKRNVQQVNVPTCKMFNRSLPSASNVQWTLFMSSSERAQVREGCKEKKRKKSGILPNPPRTPHPQFCICYGKKIIFDVFFWTIFKPF